MAYNAFKCKLKQFYERFKCPRSVVFGMSMPSSWLHQSCDSLAHSVFPSFWVLSAISPLLSLGFVIFSPLI